MSVDNIRIRLMQPEEKLAVHAVMRQAFPLVQQWFFSWSKHVLVAEREGELLGAIVLKLYDLPEERKGGLVSWVFTAPCARGLKLGQRLTEAGLDFFEQEGCVEVTACVEGFNTSSSKMFATRGFELLSFADQVRRYGAGIASVWWKIFHFVDIGHFVWARPPEEGKYSSWTMWLGSLLANALVASLALWRGNGFAPTGVSPAALLVILLCLLGVRTLAMLLAARAQGMEVQFHPWESGFVISAGIALAAGAYFPVPGAVYPSTYRWSYRREQGAYARIALAGAIPTLVLAWIVWGLLRFGGFPLVVQVSLHLAQHVLKPMALFDIALPFFPFVSFNGRRIWDWNKMVWAVLAAAALAVFFL
jgi:ribosomal protein S18 acetylase RimI-like enzyme